MSKKKEELKLINKILKKMDEFEKGLAEGIAEECFTEEQCADVRSSMPKSREDLIERKNYLQKLLAGAN